MQSYRLLCGVSWVVIIGGILAAGIMQEENQSSYVLQEENRSSCLAGAGAEVFADFNRDLPALLLEHRWSGNLAGSPAQSYPKSLQTPLRDSCMKTCRELCRNSPQEFLHTRPMEDKLIRIKHSLNLP
ncbi:hypothetical protein QAD02_020649 [Eretmocerus hayati]|uniref:Uncharacterized protein n=1 Tax=Eretmocerus hayati TaxID=131215 RepID=A0ACC2PPB0_9HYME|nr:hypothetical protein QAD02_020649 [Eretmocerus hayati]